MRNWLFKLNITVVSITISLSAVGKANSLPRLVTSQVMGRESKLLDFDKKGLSSTTPKNGLSQSLKDFKKTDMQMAMQGGIHGGGGDPLANDFLKKAENIADSIGFDLLPGLKPATSNDGLSAVFIDIDRMREITATIRKSLDNQNPLLVFPPGMIVNCFGEPKVGCVGNDGIISVAREGYLSLTPSGQFEVVALEYFKLMNLQDRYKLAQYVEYYMRGKSEKVYSSHKEYLDTLVYQIDRLVKFENGIIKNFGSEKIIGGDKLSSSCFQLAQLYSGILAYQNSAMDFIRETHPQESTFQITNKEFGILGNLEQTASSEIGVPNFCGGDVSLTYISHLQRDSHIQKGHAKDLFDRVLKPTQDQLIQIRSNLLNY